MKKEAFKLPGTSSKRHTHVALEKVDAGYDIKSFEDKLDSQGNAIYRLIEVKAVSVWDYHFYWTKMKWIKRKNIKKHTGFICCPLYPKENLTWLC